MRVAMDFLPRNLKRTVSPMSDLVIAGVGGQGTVLASKLLARAALLEGFAVRTAETIGMAQRGGSVLGHVRISRTSTFGGARVGSHSELPLSPLIGVRSADVVIGFEPGEAVRALPLLRAGGLVVTATKVMVPASVSSVTPGRRKRDPHAYQGTYDGSAELAYLAQCRDQGYLGQLVLVDGDAACQALGSPKVLNVVLLGAALATGRLDVSAQALLDALDALVKPAFLELNKRALALGMESASIRHGKEPPQTATQQSTWVSGNGDNPDSPAPYAPTPTTPKEEQA